MHQFFSVSKKRGCRAGGIPAMEHARSEAIKTSMAAAEAPGADEPGSAGVSKWASKSQAARWTPEQAKLEQRAATKLLKKAHQLAEDALPPGASEARKRRYDEEVAKAKAADDHKKSYQEKSLNIVDGTELSLENTAIICTKGTSHLAERLRACGIHQKHFVHDALPQLLRLRPHVKVWLFPKNPLAILWTAWRSRWARSMVAPEFLFCIRAVLESTWKVVWASWVRYTMAPVPAGQPAGRLQLAPVVQLAECETCGATTARII